MPTNQTHEIVTIADLFRLVNADNLASLCADMQGALMNAAMTKALLAAADLPKEAEVDMFEGAVFTWTDDGINQQTVTMESEDKGKSLQFKLTGPELDA